MSIIATSRKYAARSSTRHILWSYIFIGPAIIALFIFWVYPIARSVMLGFGEIDFHTASVDWVGFENFEKAFNDKVFYRSLINSAFYTLGTVPPLLFMILVLAQLIVRLRRSIFQTFFKSAFYLPSVASVAVIALVWKWLYEPGIGLLNYLLSLVGMEPVIWLANPHIALWSLVVMEIATGAGAGIILTTAAMGGIPKELYESARIDGANVWHEFWHVTIPLVKPTIVYLTIILAISSFQVFGPVLLMTRGGPAHATSTISYYIYSRAFEFLQFGSASAMAVVLLVILVIIAAIQYRALRSDFEY